MSARPDSPPPIQLTVWLKLKMHSGTTLTKTEALSSASKCQLKHDDMCLTQTTNSVQPQKACLINKTGWEELSPALEPVFKAGDIKSWTALSANFKVQFPHLFG